jgi:hypothetical protein
MSELNVPSVEKKVLIAARSSEFKDAVISRIKEAFKDEVVYMKFIGIDHLKKENGDDYSAVVVINTCMGWNMDRHVKSFVKRQKDQSNVVVLTTSGDGDWMPKMEDYDFDAISSASEMHKVDEIADKIIAKVRLLVQHTGAKARHHTPPHSADSTRSHIGDPAVEVSSTCYSGEDKECRGNEQET